MALDTYVVAESDKSYSVARYKATELCETMSVPLQGPCAASIEKRRKIVNQWIKEGKPSAIYWFDGDKISGTYLKVESTSEVLSQSDIHQELVSRGYIPTQIGSGMMYRNNDTSDTYHYKVDKEQAGAGAWTRVTFPGGGEWSGPGSTHIGDDDAMRKHLGIYSQGTDYGIISK